MTTEQMDAVDDARAAEEAAAVKPAARRPETGDHKPKVKKRPKAKVKVVTSKNEDGEEVPVGREVTLHGVTVTVLDAALGDFQTADDLALLGEAAEEYEAVGEKSDVTLMDAAAGVVPGLLRRLVGYEGSRRVQAALRRESSTGRIEFEDVIVFVGELIAALQAKNS